MRVMILANGDPPSGSLARAIAQRCDLVMATDGAAHKAAALGLMPSLICGDFGSADGEAARETVPDGAFVGVAGQDRGDPEKARTAAR